MDRRMCRFRACTLQEKYNIFSQENPFIFWDFANECERINTIVSWNAKHLERQIPSGDWHECLKYCVEIAVLMVSLMQRISVGVAFQTVGFMMKDSNDYNDYCDSHLLSSLQDVYFEAEYFMRKYKIAPTTFVEKKLLNQAVNSYVSLYKKMVSGPLEQLQSCFWHKKVLKGMRAAVDKVKTEKHINLEGVLTYVVGNCPGLLTAYLLSSYNADRLPSFRELHLSDLKRAGGGDARDLVDQYEMADEFVKFHRTEAQRVHVANAVLVKCFPGIMDEIDI